MIKTDIRSQMHFGVPKIPDRLALNREAAVLRERQWQWVGPDLARANQNRSATGRSAGSGPRPNRGNGHFRETRTTAPAGRRHTTPGKVSGYAPVGGSCKIDPQAGLKSCPGKWRIRRANDPIRRITADNRAKFLNFVRLSAVAG